MSNEDSLIKEIEHFPPFGLSHHCVITFCINLRLPAEEATSVIKYQIDKGDYNAMRSMISEVKWDDILTPDHDDDVDNWWDKIHSVILSATDLYVPKKKIYKQNVFKRPFAAPITLLDKIRLKRNAFKYYKKFPSTANYKIYAKFRNQVKWESKKAKRLREYKVAKDAKVNPKAFYQYVASKIKQKEPISNLLKDDGSLTEDDIGKAEILINSLSVCLHRKMTVVFLVLNTQTPTFNKLYHK